MNRKSKIKRFVERKIKVYKFDESNLPIELPDPDIVGEDTRRQRFILVYYNDGEKEFYKKLLGIDGKKVIYTMKDFYK